MTHYGVTGSGVNLCQVIDFVTFDIPRLLCYRRGTLAEINYMKRNDAWNAGLKFYRDDSGEIRRTQDNLRMHPKRSPSPARIEARRRGKPQYIDEDGYLRGTQSGALIVRPSTPKKRKLTPRAKRAECPVHGWALHKIISGECVLCIDRAVK